LPPHHHQYLIGYELLFLTFCAVDVDMFTAFLISPQCISELNSSLMPSSLSCEQSAIASSESSRGKGCLSRSSTSTFTPKRLEIGCADGTRLFDPHPIHVQIQNFETKILGGFLGAQQGLASIGRLGLVRFNPAEVGVLTAQVTEAG
jgi:hypothetical protein